MIKHKKIEPNEFYEITEQEYEILRHMHDFTGKVYPVSLTDYSVKNPPDCCKYYYDKMWVSHEKAMCAFKFIMKQILEQRGYYNITPIVEKINDDTVDNIIFAESLNAIEQRFYMSFGLIPE